MENLDSKQYDLHRHRRLTEIERKLYMVSTRDNKVAIVTGAASGIGLAIAQELAMRGVLVTLSDIDEKKGNEAAAELSAARFQYANMTSENDCQRLVTDTIRAKGHVDILVNNAGIQVSIRGSQAWTVGTNPRDGVRGSRARRHV